MPQTHPAPPLLARLIESAADRLGYHFAVTYLAEVAERGIKEQFEATLARLAKTRLSSVSKEGRKKSNRKKKN